MQKAYVSCLVSATLLGLALLLPRPAAAAWPTDPLANVPVCNAIKEQVSPVTISDGAGGAIITWCDSRAWLGYLGEDMGIFAQRISADGTPLWTLDGAALCTAVGLKGAPAIVSDGAGGAIVAWQDWRTGTDWNIFAQRISAGGVPLWTVDGEALCTAPDQQYNPAIVTDGAGGAIVTWTDARVDSNHSTNHDIYAQRISAGGTLQWTADGVALCDLTSDQLYPAIAPDGAGGAIVTWQDFRTPPYGDLYSQRVSAAGAPLWATNGVALCLAGYGQLQQTTVSDGAGGAIVTWQDGRSGTYADLYAQRISAAGTVAWTGDGVIVCPSGYSKWNPTITTDGANGAIVAWWENRFGSYDIYAQSLAATGTRTWTTYGVVVCGYYDDQRWPTIVSDGASGAIVTWQDLRSGSDYDIYAQRLSAAGTAQWTVGGVAISAATGAQSQPTLSPDGAGGALVTWMDERNAVSTRTDIYAQRVWADGSTPVLLSLVSSEVAADGVHLTWFAGENASAVATVYRSYGDGEWTRIGEVSADGTGYLRYTDRIDLTSRRVGYRLGTVNSGTESFSGETWVDLPALALALEPVRPNPSRGAALSVSFTLVSEAAASLELLDVTGRRIVTHEVGALGAGRHLLALGEGRRLAPGLYLVRLTQGASVRLGRVAVIE